MYFFLNLHKQIIDKLAGQKVTLAGWVQRVRKMGGMSFIDLRDRYGITQIVIDESASAELNAQVEKLGREYVIQVTGTVLERQSKNSRIDTGDIEVRLESLNVLNAAATPPFTIEDESDGGDDLRMKYRYLDLRRNPLKKNLMLRHRMAHEVRNYLDSKGFMEIETPYLIKSTPEGARDFAPHGGRIRPLLPDRALLQGRGPQGRPSAGVHPD